MASDGSRSPRVVEMRAFNAEGDGTVVEHLPGSPVVYVASPFPTSFGVNIGEETADDDVRSSETLQHQHDLLNEIISGHATPRIQQSPRNGAGPRRFGSVHRHATRQTAGSNAHIAESDVDSDTWSESSATNRSSRRSSIDDAGRGRARQYSTSTGGNALLSDDESERDVHQQAAGELLDTAGFACAHLGLSVATTKGTQLRGLCRLPGEVLRMIFDTHFTVKQHHSLRLVCKMFNSIITSNCCLWQRYLPGYHKGHINGTERCSLVVRGRRAPSRRHSLALEHLQGDEVLAANGREERSDGSGSTGDVLSSSAMVISPPIGGQMVMIPHLRTPQGSPHMQSSPVGSVSDLASLAASLASAPAQVLVYCFNSCAYKAWVAEFNTIKERDRRKTQRQDLRRVCSRACFAFMLPEELCYTPQAFLGALAITVAAVAIGLMLSPYYDPHGDVGRGGVTGVTVSHLNDMSLLRSHSSGDTPIRTVLLTNRRDLSGAESRLSIPIIMLAAAPAAAFPLIYSIIRRSCAQRGAELFVALIAFYVSFVIYTLVPRNFDVVEHLLLTELSAQQVNGTRLPATIAARINATARFGNSNSSAGPSPSSNSTPSSTHSKQWTPVSYTSCIPSSGSVSPGLPERTQSFNLMVAAPVFVALLGISVSETIRTLKNAREEVANVGEPLGEGWIIQRFINSFGLPAWNFNRRLLIGACAAVSIMWLPLVALGVLLRALELDARPSLRDVICGAGVSVDRINLLTLGAELRELLPAEVRTAPVSSACVVVILACAALVVKLFFIHAVFHKKLGFRYCGLNAILLLSAVGLIWLATFLAIAAIPPYCVPIDAPVDTTAFCIPASNSAMASDEIHSWLYMTSAATVLVLFLLVAWINLLGDKTGYFNRKLVAAALTPGESSVEGGEPPSPTTAPADTMQQQQQQPPHLRSSITNNDATRRRDRRRESSRSGRVHGQR